MSPQDYECLVPMLMGCRTMPFVPVSSLNLLLSLRLNLARRTTARCSTKTTDRCESYSCQKPFNLEGVDFNVDSLDVINLRSVKVSFYSKI